MRYRWYYFFSLLALVDVVIIMLSLELHDRTFSSVEHLTQSAVLLEDQAKWLKHAQQYVLEQNAPPNDVFLSADVDGERAHFERAQRQLQAKLDSAGAYDLDVASLRTITEAMAVAAKEVFSHFEASLDPGLSPAQTHARLVDASEAMSRMDNKQLEAIRKIGVLAARNEDRRKGILDQHEATLLAQINNERYIIAAIAALLFGLLWFGYRLQKTGEALGVQRRALIEERRERLAAIGELCSSVAHGIKNPLAAMRSSAQLALEMGKLDSGSRQRLQDILDEGGRLGDRVNGILSIARENTDAFEEISLHDLVASAIREIEPEIRRRGLAVRQDFADDPIAIRGDRHQLEQVVIELLSNAMEHATDESVIRISCHRPRSNGLASIAVQNDGPTVPDELRSRIFDLFFTTKPSGTGIGLATVKRIAHLHGGGVELINPPQGGARFIVSLPVATGKTARLARRTKAARNDGPASRTTGSSSHQADQPRAT